MDRSYQSNTAGLRADWKFKYSGAKLAAAAKEQLAYREGRVEVWTGKKKETMEKIRSEGIDIHHESVAEKMVMSNAYTTSSAHGAQIVIDPTLQADLTECVGKIQQHRQLVEIYRSWVQVLEANPEAHLDLNHNDWMFFFGR